jgi:hypothetical protein
LEQTEHKKNCYQALLFQVVLQRVLTDLDVNRTG